MNRRRFWRNWFGLRCRARHCPCVAVNGGWQCVICGKREWWTEEIRKHYEDQKGNQE